MKELEASSLVSASRIQQLETSAAAQQVEVDKLVLSIKASSQIFYFAFNSSFNSSAPLKFILLRFAFQTQSTARISEMQQLQQQDQLN